MTTHTFTVSFSYLDLSSAVSLPSAVIECYQSFRPDYYHFITSIAVFVSAHTLLLPSTFID